MNTKVNIMRTPSISETLTCIKRRLKNILRGKIPCDHSNLFVPVAVFWFLVRVVPKPIRIVYPCQRAALSLLFLKTGIVLSLALTALFSKKTVKILCIGGLCAMCFGLIFADQAKSMYYLWRYHAVNKSAKLITLDAVYGASNFPIHRVVRVYSDSATNWDFQTEYYWQYVDQSAVDRMVEEGVKALTGASDAQTAWQMIMSSYVPGDKVGIKVNGNDFWNDNENEIDAIPQVINAVIKGLRSIGIPEEKIHVLEPTIGAYGGGRGNGRRLFYQYYYDMINGLYPNVLLLDGDDSTFVEGGDAARVDFPYVPGSRRISDLIVNVDHLILMPIMKAITPNWGITGSIKLMQGVIQDPMSLHNELARETDDNPNALIYKNQHIIGKTRLIVGDGLFGMWSGIHFPAEENGKSDVPDPWITFSNGAPNSLFFSIDPVAIDSVMRDFVNNERSARGLSSLPAPQLVAGQAAGLGIFEEAPYSNIDYIEFELGEPPSPIHDC